MIHVPPEVLEAARKAAACLQEIAAVQLRFGLMLNHDYDGGAELDPLKDSGFTSDTKWLQEKSERADSFGFRVGQEMWHCHDHKGRRLVANTDWNPGNRDVPFDDDEYVNHDTLRWDWLDEPSVTSVAENESLAQK